MATKKTHREPSIPDKKHFEALKPFVEKVAVGSSRQSFFTLCVKASLAKCFEFNIAIRNRKGLDESFFWMPALRGICEDLIVLNFVKTMPRSDRDNLILKLMAHDAKMYISISTHPDNRRKEELSSRRNELRQTIVQLRKKLLKE